MSRSGKIDVTISEETSLNKLVKPSRTTLAGGAAGGASGSPAAGSGGTPRTVGYIPTPPAPIPAGHGGARASSVPPRSPVNVTLQVQRGHRGPTARRVRAARDVRGTVVAVSKKTDKRKQKARKCKANHGSKPNAGRP